MKALKTKSPVSLWLVKSLTVILLLLTCHNSWSQYRISTCDELALRPIDPVTDDDILAIHLDTEKYGDKGCLVFHHPNGKDYVITPTSWTRTPDSARMKLIEAAMDAMADSRKKYTNYGELSEHLYYIFDHIDRVNTAALTFFIVGDGCWMISGEVNIQSETSVENIKQTFAHEIGHCFVMRNVENLSTDVDVYNSLNHWFDESVSEYLSAEVYPRNNGEYSSANKFKFDSLFRQEYSAYVLWLYLVQEKGISSVVPLMNHLANRRTSSARFDYMRDKDLDKLFHHFLFDFTMGQIYDSGGGTIPNNDPFTPNATFHFTPENTKLDLPKVKQGQREVYFLKVPPGYDLSIDPPAGSDVRYFQSFFLAGGMKIKDWESPITVTGKCQDTTLTAIIMSHLNDAVISNLSIEYELEERTSCCEAGTLVEANPWENVNETFYFDHYIESIVTIEGPDELMSVDFNYYANSKDGSLYFNKENIMNIAAGVSGDEFHGAIWMANGQNVIYGLDSANGIKRAVTIATDQTKQDVMTMRSLRVSDFIENAVGGNMAPARLPAGSEWQGKSRGYATYQADTPGSPDINRITMYFSDDTTNITSPLPAFGFMAGYIRDHNGQNKKLVYTEILLANGEKMSVELKRLEKECVQFDGNGYKKATVAGHMGRVGQMSLDERNQLVESQEEYYAQLKLLIDELAACDNDKACEAEINKRVMELERQRMNAIRGLPNDPNHSGTEGTEFETEQQKIENRMYLLSDRMIDKELECDRIKERLNSCDPGICEMIQREVDRCDRQYQSMKDEMVKLQCDLAKLMGMEDVYEPGECD